MTYIRSQAKMSSVLPFLHISFEWIPFNSFSDIFFFGFLFGFLQTHSENTSVLKGKNLLLKDFQRNELATRGNNSFLLDPLSEVR